MNHKRLISLTTCFMLSVVLGLSVSSFADNDSETNTEAEQHFEKAYELRKAADYDAAIAEYEKVISLSPNSKIAQNAQYWIGQSYFESKQFDAALSAFQGLLDKYPASSIAPSTKQMIERVQQAKKNRALFEAVNKPDIEQVKLLIAKDADLNAKWGDASTQEQREKANAEDPNKTPLCFAVDTNDMDVVKLLVEAGADVNAGSWPPLCRVVDKNNTAIAEYLIDHGANVNARKDWGPLQETTAISNSVKMAKLLIARGADINSKGYPVLNSAIYAERKDLCEFLIQRGADVNAKDKWGQTSLYLAVDKDDLDYLKILIAHGAKVDTKCPGGETVLMFAALTGRTEVVRLLLEAGADTNIKDDRGQTALHVPLDTRNYNYWSRYYNYGKYKLSKDMVELLLAKGADVNLKDKDGRTPLHLAAELADANIVKLLLDKGARVNEKDDESGFTALHHAARFGNKDAAEVLIARGADINAKDKQGHTPLQVAVNHDYKVAELLINKGADSSIRTESSQTLLQLVQQRKQTESLTPDLILDGMGEPHSNFGAQIVCGDVDGDGYDDVLIDNSRGRVYLFYGGPDMDTTADLIFEGQNEGDWFGCRIACGDIDNDAYDDIVIGAGGYSEKRGRVYLYWGSDRDSMDAHPDKILVGEEEKGSEFGEGTPAVYDIDNDGYNDIIVGACDSSNQRGRAYLYYGNTKELMDTSADLIFIPEGPGRHRFGSLISCGDVDNDGYGDIVIGNFAWQGRAYLYYGASKSNMDAKADVVFKAQSKGNECFGFPIVCADQNRDGYDDIVIGARRYNNTQGRAYLFYGNSKESMNANPDMVFNGEVEGGSYGFQEVSGDIDGDKLNDLIIGANFYRRQTGRVYVYWGNELTGPDPKPGRILTGENPKDYFGFGLACGDVNNDGFDDLVIGAYGYKAGANQGCVYLYYGGPRNK
jgi:ankyrin repeat protein